MVHSKKDSKDFVKVPTLEEWIKTKEESHKKIAKLPFIKKLEIIDRMESSICQEHLTHRKTQL